MSPIICHASSYYFIVGKLLLCGSFLIPGILKIPDPAGFALQVSGYQLLPWPFVFVAAYYLPWLEVVAASGLWWRKIAPGALAILVLLLLIFLAALLSAEFRGLDIQCGCYGGESGSTHWAILRNLVLLAVALALWTRQSTSSAMPS